MLFNDAVELQRDDEQSNDIPDELIYKHFFTSMEQGFAMCRVIRDEQHEITDWQYLDVNPAIYQHAGIYPADLIGKTASEMKTVLNPWWLDTVKRVVDMQQSENFEYHNAVFDRWHEVTLYPAGADQFAILYADISDRKNVARELIQSERKYKTLFANIDEGYCIIKILYDGQKRPVNWLFLETNDAFETNNGLKGAQGKTVRDLVPDIEDKWIYVYDNVARTGEAVRFEDESAALNRAFSLYAFRVGNGDEAHVAVIFTDITQRRNTERLMRENEMLLQAQKDAFAAAMIGAPLAACLDVLINAIHVQTENEARAGFYMIPADKVGLYLVAGMDDSYAADVNGFVVGAESLACGLAMHPGQPVITPDVLEDPLWAPFLAMAEKHRIRGCWSIPVRTTGGPVLGTLSVYFTSPRTPTERELDMMGILSHAAAIIMARFNEQQERAGFERTLRDTEARHRMELEQEVRARTAELRETHSQIKSVFDTTLIQLSILRAERNQDGTITDFRILLVNKELQRETGRTDLVGRLYAKEYPGIIKTGMFELIVKAVETGVTQSLEYHYPHDGFDKWYSCMFVKFEDGVVASNLDITARKRADQKIKDLEAEQQREIVRATFTALEDERHRFADSLHHGLGQVLYGVNMSLGKLSLKKALADPKAYAEAHLYTGKLLNQAIHDARNISHQLMPLALYDHGLEVAIENICTQMSSATKFVARFQGRSANLEQYAALAIYRIVQELITNVSKHAKATTCIVNLGVSPGSVKICVSDNGIGMPDDRVNPVGIGLATIRNKVQLLHGTFEAQNRAGGGLSIEIEIPVEV